MDVPANGFAEEKDDQWRVDQKDIFYRVILFLATVTFGLFSSVLGADDAPFRPIMGKRGEAIRRLARRAAATRVGVLPVTPPRLPPPPAHPVGARAP